MVNLSLSTEFDVLTARQRAMQVAGLCGFHSLDQVRLGTIVSDLARDLVGYGAGTVRFTLREMALRMALEVAIRQDSPEGAPDVPAPAAGQRPAPRRARWGAQDASAAANAARGWSDAFHADLSAARPGFVFSRGCPPGADITPESFARHAAAFEGVPVDEELARALQRNAALTSEFAGPAARPPTLRDNVDQLARASRAMGERADAALQADAHKGEFLAILAHELRSPLAAAGAAAELLVNAQSVQVEQLRSIGLMIRRQVRHMSRLTEDLLDVSRFTRGAIVLASDAVDLPATIADAIEQVGELIRRKGQRVQWLCTAPATVSGDATRLVQVFANLLANASRYSGRGTQIGIALTAIGSEVLVEIVDEGIGMEPAVIASLFAFYAQAHVSADGREGGLGLGLALVGSLVVAHGGTVAAHSAGPGTGSVFSVRLPLAGQG
ncbi:signal transduction histidine kinase [Pseudoduganella lurida]|uniref:histidine kinase n=1 Tax=Pseudoduganella lurida TaxID=1036180 RepID=A0A562R242_9BURK|nr:sensor histidine kinase [Pseudoduganella lurida]TWI62654.1 signal transduction histidine kinase [Pseudoduganella lurida]